ncbi:MAG TPA: hypothetical protein VKR55_06295 [Bradyrhizobium sp.]|uniref:hypothetical protein n=1 Tax=Bradyrhizobium sp. TaxID=376 RepID=UPI002BA0224C|nr:hypothetical protein [Bradyrhizobium sp.]HLZ01748.1 hypothetical protein [Bradyrhizobium sp.]
MADVYATSRHGAARESRRSRQDKKPQGAARRSGEKYLQFQSPAKHYEYPTQLVVFAKAVPLQSFRHLAAVKMISNGII